MVCTGDATQHIEAHWHVKNSDRTGHAFIQRCTEHTAWITFSSAFLPEIKSTTVDFHGARLNVVGIPMDLSQIVLVYVSFPKHQNLTGPLRLNDFGALLCCYSAFIMWHTNLQTLTAHAPSIHSFYFLHLFHLCKGQVNVGVPEKFLKPCDSGGEICRVQCKNVQRDIFIHF